MFTGIEVVVDRYCFHELISMALANEPTLFWQSTCDGSMLGNGTGLLHSSGPTALAWPSHTLVLGYEWL